MQHLPFFGLKNLDFLCQKLQFWIIFNSTSFQILVTIYFVKLCLCLKRLEKAWYFWPKFQFSIIFKTSTFDEKKSFYVESWVQYLWFFSFGKISPKSRKGVEKYFKFIRLLNILSGRYCSYTKLLLFFTFLFYKVKKSVI